MRLIVLAAFLAFVNQVQGKEIAFTFDDAPGDASGYFDGPTRAKKLLAELKQHQIDQVAFFALSQSLDDEGKARIQAYDDAGHIIANHTHSHPALNNIELAEYIAEINTAEAALNGYTNFKKWFRFPYLQEGDNKEKRDGVRHYLKQNNYLNGYVTLNTFDWYIENLFQTALKNNQQVDLEKLKQFYIEVIIEGIEYYDGLAIRYLKRSPKHVILLHEMDITAMFVGDLADALRTKGWQVISPEKAYQDQIARFQTSQLMKYNPGRIGEIAQEHSHPEPLWHRSLDQTYLQQRFNNEVVIKP